MNRLPEAIAAFRVRCRSHPGVRAGALEPGARAARARRLRRRLARIRMAAALARARRPRARAADAALARRGPARQDAAAHRRAGNRRRAAVRPLRRSVARARRARVVVQAPAIVAAAAGDRRRCRRDRRDAAIRCRRAMPSCRCCRWRAALDVRPGDLCRRALRSQRRRASRRGVATSRRAFARAGAAIGIAWAGAPHHLNDRRRSMPPALLAPLFALPDIAWFSLQKGPRESAIADVPNARVRRHALPADAMAANGGADRRARRRRVPSTRASRTLPARSASPSIVHAAVRAGLALGPRRRSHAVVSDGAPFPSAGDRRLAPGRSRQSPTRLRQR